MKRKLVASSAIRAVGYDAKSRTMEVEYAADEIYDYFPVPEDLYRELLLSRSKGSFVEQRVKGRFIYRRVE